jgi:hypothetical protein
MSSADREQNLRGEAIRMRAMVAHALCALAYSEAHAGETITATDTVRAARVIIDELGVAIAEPQRVSASAARELIEFSRELDHRIRNIETAIRLAI